MDSYVLRWFLVVSYGFLWFPLVSKGFPMVSYGFPIKPVSYGFLCFPMVSYGFLWFQVEIDMFEV